MISIDVCHGEKVVCDVDPSDLKTRLNDGAEPRKVAWLDVMDPTAKNGRRKVTIRTGVGNGTKTQVTSGLKQGEKLVLPS